MKKKYIVTVPYIDEKYGVKFKCGQVVELTDEQYGIFGRVAGLQDYDEHLAEVAANAERIAKEEEAVKLAAEAEAASKAV